MMILGRMQGLRWRARSEEGRAREQERMFGHGQNRGRSAENPFLVAAGGTKLFLFRFLLIFLPAAEED